MIEEYVAENKTTNIYQLKRLGFSLDWTRYHYSLEPDIVAQVLQTFKKLHQDGLVYRGERIVNFCTRCGTSFSDLEVEYDEQENFLYYLDYGPIQIATTRPETIFADTAVAVSPTDKRYNTLTEQKAIIPLINKEISIITDEAIEKDFGTGALKVTPGHDFTDYDIGQRHQLKTLTVIDKSGRMINVPEKYLGKKVKEARELVTEELGQAGKLVKKELIKHNIGSCYRCKTTIEPLMMAQWFVKTKPLAAPAIKAVKEGKTKIIPQKRFEKMYFDWLENIHDWNIGRQIVWGPRIPIWYCLGCNQDLLISFISKKKEKVSGFYSDLKDHYTYEEIKEGLQTVAAGQDPVYTLEDQACPKCGGNQTLQETDTFDTWFLSGQWPLTTLSYPDSPDFKYFYPTSVLDTLWDILFFWVGRMMIFGLYLAKEVPFEVIHLHARVVDQHGQKMSKSKGNTLDPLEMVDKYGADALRMALVYGVAPASDIHLSEDKIRAMRNFVTKLTNIGRFIVELKPERLIVELKPEGQTAGFVPTVKQHPDDQWVMEELNQTIKTVTKALAAFRFNDASETLYEFIWHKLADVYIEKSKGRREEAQPTLEYVFKTSLELLHPFMPFITEELWQKLPHEEKSIMVTKWPQV